MKDSASEEGGRTTYCIRTIRSFEGKRRGGERISKSQMEKDPKGLSWIVGGKGGTSVMAIIVPAPVGEGGGREEGVDANWDAISIRCGLGDGVFDRCRSR